MITLSPLSPVPMPEVELASFQPVLLFWNLILFSVALSESPHSSC
jgi:hypothetical protein